MNQTLCALLFLFGLTPALAAVDLSQLKVDPHYKLELYQGDVGGARSMTVGSNGTVFVGTRGDKVYALKGGKKYELAKGLNQPNGVAFKNGDLYVAEISRISKFEKIESHLSDPPKPIVI